MSSADLQGPRKLLFSVFFVCLILMNPPKVIAMHTFWVLFMEWRVHRYVMWGMLIFSWSAIATVVIAGPATMNMSHNGPYCKIYAISDIRGEVEALHL